MRSVWRVTASCVGFQATPSPLGRSKVGSDAPRTISRRWGRRFDAPPPKITVPGRLPLAD